MPAIRSVLVVTAVLIGTGTYFDDAPTRLTTDMQITYEDHIADLRAQVDRIMSRKFLDQKQVEQQLNALLQRQTTLEQHTSALTDDLSGTASIKLTPTAPPAVAVEKLGWRVQGWSSWYKGRLRQANDGNWFFRSVSSDGAFVGFELGSLSSNVQSNGNFNYVSVGGDDTVLGQPFPMNFATLLLRQNLPQGLAN